MTTKMKVMPGITAIAFAGEPCKFTTTKKGTFADVPNEHVATAIDFGFEHVDADADAPEKLEKADKLDKSDAK